MDLTLRAPAKLNLFLEVMGKRPDGFHELRTVMVPISLFDDVRFRRIRSGTRVTFDPPRRGATTVGRAVALIRRRTGWRGGVWIHVTKRIPEGSGLGGGSADGAAVLVGLNRMARLGLAREELSALAARIGSDVPFFLARGPALCAGRGVRVTPLKLERSLRFMVVKPHVSISTADVYGRLRPTRGPRRPVDAFLRALAGGRIEGALFNRLEGPAFALYPPLRRLRRSLGRGALMTGSGSAIFALKERTLRPRFNSARIWNVTLLKNGPGWDE